jgi:hypothetical protein
MLSQSDVDDNKMFDMIRQKLISNNEFSAEKKTWALQTEFKEAVKAR